MMTLKAVHEATASSFKSAAAFVAICLGVACGSSDGGSSADGGVASDGGVLDGSSVADGGATGDGSTGDASAPDGDNGGDSGGDSADATDGATFASPSPVQLGAAGTFAILAKSAISTVPTSAVTGDLGISPMAATFITGFSLTADSTNVFSTSTQVTGKVYAADYAVPTPANLTAAIGAMQLAFTDAAGRAPDVLDLGAGDIGGRTLTRGVYKWSTGLMVPTDVTLTGSATDVWIFQVADDLTVSNGTNIVLAGGAVAKNVFWQVSGSVEIGTTSHFEGVVLGQTAITLRTGASIDGRLLAQTAVSIDASTVVEPAP